MNIGVCEHPGVAAYERPGLDAGFGARLEGIGCPTGLARRFRSEPSSVGAARRAVDELAPWLEPELLEDLRLLVSELMANSVEHGPRHAGRAIVLRMSVLDARVRVEVSDGGPGFVASASPPPVDAPAGRGLFLVDQLAARWGVTSADGTCVWLELDRERVDPARDGREPARGVSGVPTAA